MHSKNSGKEPQNRFQFLIYKYVNVFNSMCTVGTASPRGLFQILCMYNLDLDCVVSFNSFIHFSVWKREGRLAEYRGKKLETKKKIINSFHSSMLQLCFNETANDGNQSWKRRALYYTVAAYADLL
jgi:hypothetical protein